MSKAYANYQVSLKILLKKGDEFLFLRTSVSERFDLPGGRIDDIEHNIPFTKIIAREVREELGEEIKYKLGKLIFQFRIRFEDTGKNIFVAVYEAEYLSGEIKLSDEHSDFEWINPKGFNFQEKDFFNKEEFELFKNYFESLG